MAHRGPFREMLGLLCMALIFPRSERITPASNTTGYTTETVNAVVDTDKYKSLMVPLSTPTPSTTAPSIPPPPTGLLSFLLPFFASLFSVLGEELLSLILNLMLTNGLMPSLRIMKRLIVWIGTSAYHRIQELRTRGRVTNGDTNLNSPYTTNQIDDISRSRPPQATTPTSIDDDEWYDAEESQSPTNEQTLADLRAASAAKDGQIASLTKTARAKSNTITYLDQRIDRNARLVEDIRLALDPQKLYPNDTDIITIAEDVTRDIRRVSKKIDRQRKELEEAIARQENGQLAQKDGQITRLSADNARLKTRILRLEEGQQSCVKQVELMERKAEEKIKGFKERVVEAEDHLSRAILPRTYQSLRDQFDVVLDRMQKAEQEREAAINAQGTLTADLESERARTQELQTIIDNAAGAQQQSESLVTTTPDDLQLAKDRIASLEMEAEAKNKEVQDAQTRAQAAEAKVTSHATLQQELQEARNSDKASRDSNKQLKQRLQKTEEALKKKASEPKPEAAGASPNHDQHAELENLRSQICESSKKEAAAFETAFLQGLAANPPINQDQETAAVDVRKHDQHEASTQTEETTNGPTYQQGYQKALEECTLQTQTLLNDAVQKERLEGQDRLNAAVAAREEAIKASAEENWRSREAEWSAHLKAEVEKAATQGQERYQDELNVAVQRATRAEARATTAETRANNVESALTEAQKSRDEMQATATSEWSRANREEGRANEAEGKALAEYNRAQVAEEEVRKYREGKAEQDRRIQNYIAEINTYKSQTPTKAKLMVAELEHTMGERMRANAVIDEFCHRSYDHDTRVVVKQLLQANAKIVDLKMLLKSPRTKGTRTECLVVLQDAEVDTGLYTKLHEPNRQVLVKQCRAVNAKLADLKTLINQSEQPDKVKLLTEMYRARGDEQIEWDDDDPLSEPSSDEDDAEVRNPSFRRKRLPTSRRVKPAAGPRVQDTPLPNGPRTNNQLKRKDESDDFGAAGKRRETSEMDMRPTAGPSFQIPQQGSSSLEAADETMETKAESQNEVPSSERKWEAAVAQQQSNNQTASNSQPPGAPSPSVQLFTSAIPATSSETLSHVAQAPHTKPTKIPGPKSKAHLTPQERQERLRYRYSPDSEAASAQQAAASSSADRTTSFSFNAPKDIAPGIRPHVRKYSRLSRKTNIMLSSRQPDASNAEPETHLPRTLAFRRSDGGQEVDDGQEGSITRTSTTRRRRGSSGRILSRDRRPEFRP